MGNTYWVIAGCCVLVILVVIFFINRKKKGETEQQEEWNPEKKFDSERMGRSYNFPDSVALAVEFFFRAKLGKLDEKEQLLIHIDPERVGIRCEYTSPGNIEHDSSGESRLIYFGTRKNPNCLFRVVVIRRTGQSWRVAGFHYPHDSLNHFYAVFTPHHYWFGWRDESCFLSARVNPGY